jgi:ABC-type lipoprotein release transport system permease subunit
MLIKTAWRNVWRHPVRSLVIMSSVAIGLWAGVALMSFYYGVGEQQVKTAISIETSHLQIHQKEFKKDYDVRYFIKYDSLLSVLLQNDRRVRSFSKRTVIRSMVSTASGSRGATVFGIDPPSETNTTSLSGKLIYGHYVRTNEPFGIVVGERLLSKMNVKANSKIILTFNDNKSDITAGAFKVCGVFRTENAPFDEQNVFVNRTTLNELAGTEGTSNEIAVVMEAGEEPDSLRQELQKRFPENSIETWRELSPETDYVISVIDQMMYIFIGIIFLGIGFGIVNTMLMSTLERQREIGMLTALGMNKRRLFTMIVYETVFLVVAGAPIGMAGAIGTVTYFHRHGISFERFKDVFSNFGYAHTVYPTLEIRHYFTVGIMVVITSLLAAIIPAYRALQIRPGEAIRK